MKERGSQRAVTSLDGEAPGLKFALYLGMRGLVGCVMLLKRGPSRTVLLGSLVHHHWRCADASKKRFILASSDGEVQPQGSLPGARPAASLPVSGGHRLVLRWLPGVRTSSLVAVTDGRR